LLQLGLHQHQDRQQQLRHVRHGLRLAYGLQRRCLQVVELTMAAFGEIRDPLIGTRIDDRYLVQGILGRGGMGVVYDGVHEQLGRPVAIKVLGASVAGDPTAVQRFLREARTASQLTHGNIVDVSDLGQLPDGRPYLVMAKMHGVDLATLLQNEGPQTPRRTAELLRGAAAALDLIHAKGYVHRDVKPENLMHIVREDGSEAVLLLDFGIVGLMSGAHSARLTSDGSVFGTPAYLPPEVIQGEPPDRRADVYALATVAFELITGRPPFHSTNPLRILPMKVMEDAPSMMAVTGFEFPDALEDALAKGLARDPKHRHGSAGAFVAALDAAALLHPIAAERSLPPPAAVGGGVDRAAGEQPPHSATDPLDMPFGDSAAPDLDSVTDRMRPSKPDVRARRRLTFQLPVPGRRKPVVWIAAITALLALLLGWFALRNDAQPQLSGAPSPEPVPTPAVAASTYDETLPVPSEPLPAVVEPPPAAAPVPAVLPASVTRAAKRISQRDPPAQSKPAPAGPSATELGLAAQRELIQGHLAAAAELYAQATRVDPRNEPAWRGLGLANERLGRTADAVRALRRAIQLSPNGQNADMLRARLQKLGGTL
jgi:serine/threonine-protein kinase